MEIDQQKLNAALLVDNLLIANYQKQALINALELLEIKIIINCQNTVTRKNSLKHFLCYFLNLSSIKNYMSKPTSLPDELNGVEIINFNSLYEGSFQVIPNDIYDLVKIINCKIIIKFGMNFLRIKDNAKHFDILSYEHGGPEKYPNNLAGFHEISENAEKLEIIVQKLSHTDDSGKVYARAFSKVFNYSYKKTSIEYLLASRFLLRKAVINYRQSKEITIKELRKDHAFPSNFQVVKFFIKLIKNKISRILYGAFYEKSWNIMKGNIDEINFEGKNSLTVKNHKTALIEKRYSFYTDQFFSQSEDIIRVEAMNKISSKGEIVELSQDTLEFKRVILGDSKNHYSYPSTFIDKDNEFILPEVASHSKQFLIRKPYEENNKIFLRGLEQPLIDPNLIKFRGVYYLFAGFSSSGTTEQNLFYSVDSFIGPYKPHQLNPIVVNPKGARNAGRIYKKNGELYRFGQNNTSSYGNGIVISKITELSDVKYSEEEVGSIGFTDCFGPHTIDIKNREIVLDFYKDKFNFFAGLNRIKNRFF